MKTWKTNHVAGLLAAAALAAGLGPIGSAHSQDNRPAKPPTDLETLVQGNNQFAFDLYARLAKKEGNIVFSPYSISSALAMAYAGARGETAKQMADILHFKLNQDRLHPAFGELNKATHFRGNAQLPYQFQTANALWPRIGFPVEQDFRRIAATHYGADLQALDFQSSPNTARQAINKWVASRTNNKIPELLKPDDVNSRTQIFLTNAAYFKAGWVAPFPSSATKNEVFEAASGKKPKVPMMHHRNQEFNHFIDKECYYLELPYDDLRASMVVMLPVKSADFAKWERSLTWSKVRTILSRLGRGIGDVAIPRFSLRDPRHVEGDLMALGMIAAFKDDADFSGMTPHFRISSVIHEATIDVDERGTEAAAATGIGYDVSQSDFFSFRADRPFLFLLRDHRTKSILFLGRVQEFDVR